MGTVPKEVKRLHQLMQLYRLMPAEPFVTTEAVRLQDVIPHVIALHGHHIDLRGIPIEVSVRGDAQPVLVRPSALLRCLLVLLESAAGSALRAGGEPTVTLEYGGGTRCGWVRFEGTAPAGQLVFTGDGSLVHAVHTALAHAHGTATAEAIHGTGTERVRYEVTLPTLAEARRMGADGPLRKSFEDLGVRVNVLQTRFAENLADRIDRHLRDARNQDGRLRGLGLGARGLRRLGKIPLMYDAPFFLKLLLAAPFVKRNVYLNSFSAWPIAVALGKLRSFDRMVWFIHESCDPNLLLPGRRLKIAFSKLARKPWLRFVFGSDATWTIWSKAGIDGVTRYWSGLASNSHPRKARAPGAAVKSMLSVDH